MQATEISRERDNMNTQVVSLRQELAEAKNEVANVRRSIVEEKQSLERSLDEERKRTGGNAQSHEVVQRNEDVFSWHHLDYIVPLPDGGQRKLLDDISGYVAPGKLTALMGESGAGKTTLLNVLAQRVSMGVVTGDRLVNGQALPPDFQAQTGYCQQMDTHVPTATVREALLFSAKLRQPASVPLEEKEA